MSARDVNLAEHLDLIAAAPEGIGKLRGLILELAVRGKLVPQEPKDEPASELLKRIAQERARLEAEGVCKKSKPLPPVVGDEQSFALPHGWQWSRFAAYAIEVSTGPFGSMLHQSDYVPGGIPLVNPSHMLEGKIVPESRVAVDEVKANELSSYRLNCGDIVMARRGEVGRTALVTQNEDGWLCGTGSFVIRLASEASRHFVILLFRASSIRRYLGDEAVGTTMVNLNHGILNSMPVAVPPLAEQHRIVAKVDELMALCDQLEAEQTDSASAHAKVVDTLLCTLTQSTDAAELAANWQRLAEHFNPLFTTESSLDALKQTILQLAVMGKLVVGKSERWETQRLDKICSEIVDCPHSTPKWTLSGKICVRTNQFRPGKLELSSSRFVSESTFAERISRLKPEVGDILYSREGGILGVACRIPPGVELCLGQRMMLIRPGSEVDPTFLEVVLNSPIITELARQNTTGGAAPRVNVATVKAYPIPVPPLAEQHRIVAKVDELMALCDHLKADLGESRTQQARLSATLIESALAAA